MSSVNLTRDGALAQLHLDNPGKGNCLTTQMLEQLAAHLDAIERSSEIACVLLTHEGNKAFCTGADINDWSSLNATEFARHWVRGGHRIFDRLAALAQPTVAVMNGHAFGGGLELAAACDFRVMHPDATIAMLEPAVGIVPGWSGTQRLCRLLPESAVKEMVLFGRRISAERAHALGFVAEVSQEPFAVAKEVAARSAKLSPRALEISKIMLHAGSGEQSAALIEALGGAVMSASADCKEGVAAFREKRSPEFLEN